MRSKAKRVRSLSRGYKQENNYGKIFLTVFFVILFVAAMFFFIRIFSIRNSEEFSLDKLSVYYLYEKAYQQNSAENSDSGMNMIEGKKKENYLNNKLVIVDGQKKVVRIITVPSQLYVYSKRLDVSNVEPYKVPVIFSELLGIKSNYVYSILMKNEYLKKTGIKDTESFIQEFSKRGLNIFEYFTLRSQVEALRPESVITEASLAKLYNALGMFNLRRYEIPTITKAPMKITVGDKVYLRIYADELKFEELKKDLSE